MILDIERLKKFLIDSELITPQTLKLVESDIKETSRKFEDVLIRRNLVSEEILAKAKAYVLGIPFVDLSREIIDPEILKIIPEPIARRNNIVAFRKHGNSLEVAMLDPSDLQIIDFIKKKSSLNILPRLTSRQSLENGIKQYQKSLEEEFSKIIKTESLEILKTTKESLNSTDESSGELERIAKELPIVRIVDTLIKHAILENASDIHIEPEEKDVIVRYRVDGSLHEIFKIWLR